ncbi:putative glucuronosyltransferase [Helianthus anomalus]
MVDEKELCVVHYTLGPLKPWDWWTSWLLKPEVKEHLGGGRNPHDHLLVDFLFCSRFSFYYFVITDLLNRLALPFLFLFSLNFRFIISLHEC